MMIIREVIEERKSIAKVTNKKHHSLVLAVSYVPISFDALFSITLCFLLASVH